MNPYYMQQRRLDEKIEREKREAVANLRRECEAILAAIAAGRVDVYYDGCTGFCTITAGGYTKRNRC